jgi:hypothetical protein
MSDAGTCMFGENQDIRADVLSDNGISMIYSSTTLKARYWCPQENKLNLTYGRTVAAEI